LCLPDSSWLVTLVTPVTPARRDHDRDDNA
jgi:hypothetical protein